MNTNLADRILDEIREHYPKLQTQEDLDLKTTVFRRYPHLRLTYQGYKLLVRLYDSYTFKTEAITPGNKIKLYRHNHFPYYMGKEHFVIFMGEDAAMAKMVGDINSWIEYNYV